MVRQHGFTLIEIVAVICLLAVVMSFVAADMGSLIRRPRYEAAVRRVVANLSRARTEARLRRLPVHACAANFKSNLDLQGCLPLPKQGPPYRWEQGLIVFYDRPDGIAGVYDSKELLAVNPLDPGLPLQLSAMQQRLTFLPSGLLSESRVELEFRARQDDWCRRIVVYKAGMVRQLECA
ncbi:GspH/FimT family pseudopilin [Vogesella sp. LIG4]|uniref:GspH/FimT family pseudopilin n=1 Tax=Vogesella sp. LIG4 TaxID=1192162 RepID=UPI00081F91C9|nr:GspH/FimT family pseudopilin [Vogesella sp. LIG4]SCK15140.1 type IV fimbrial biogenesis protein FimT [Vogesella sp. LIG4]